MPNPTTLKALFISFIFSAVFSQIQAQNETGPVETHYVFPDFAIGSVKMKDGRTEKALMDYNKLTEEMIFDKDGVKLALDSLMAIDTIYIESRIFIPHEKIFYEILVIGPVSLFIQHKCNLLFAGNPSGYGGRSETGASRNLSSLTNTGRVYKLTLPGDYHVTDATQLWIRRNSTFYKANTSPQIMKIFPEKSSEIKQFMKQNSLDLKNINDLITLVVQLNDLIR